MPRFTSSHLWAVASDSGRVPQAAIWPSPDYSWMGVWRMSGEDQIRALTRQYSYRRFPFRSGVEIHLSGERRVYTRYSG